MNRIKKNDSVIVTAGKSKGHKGVVLKVITAENYDDVRVVVEGANMMKKHVKADPNRGKQGGIVEKEAAMPLSNVSLLNPQTDKADRVGFKYLENGTKVRYFKSNGELVDQ